MRANGIYKDIEANKDLIFNYDQEAPSVGPGDEIKVSLYTENALPVTEIMFRIKEIKARNDVWANLSDNGSSSPKVVIGEWLDPANEDFEFNLEKVSVHDLQCDESTKSTWPFTHLRLIPGCFNMTEILL